MGLDPAAHAGDGAANEYAKKRAAHVGTPTEHGPSISSGSPDVRINKHAAWRVDLDTVECTGTLVAAQPNVEDPLTAVDGPEVVIVGSNTVRINGKDAVRQFDVAVGAGAPNAVTGGSPNVRIGEAGTQGGYGMDNDELMAEYCKKLCELVGAWPGMTPAQRRAATEALIHWFQDRAGIPRSGIEWGSGASFDGNNWKLIIPNHGDEVTARNEKGEPTAYRPLFEQEKIRPGLFGGNVVHETRHGEQQIMAARYRIAKNGMDNTPANVARIMRETRLPRRIVERAFEMPRYAVGSHEYRYARLMDVSVNSGVGDVPDYSLRGNERDGKMVGYMGNCHGCC